MATAGMPIADYDGGSVLVFFSQERVDGEAEAFGQCVHRQTTVVPTHAQPYSDFDFLIALTTPLHVLNLLHLHRDVLFLAGFLRGEDIRDFFVRRVLAADGTLNGASVGAHAVLFDNNGNAFITETVPTGQDCPLEKKTQNMLRELLPKIPSNVYI